jgi:peptidoglycan-N-acetylglucosamine deacetylase
MAIGNHTEHHVDLALLGEEEVKAELSAAQRDIEAATGTEPSWLRPPKNASTPDVLYAARSLGLKPARWNLDTNDWRPISAEEIAQRIVEKVRPGFIVQMHDGGGDRRRTAEALRLALPALVDRGYAFVTLDEI